MSHPSQHRNLTELLCALGDGLPPLAAPVFDPRGLVCHIIAVHVVIHRHVRLIHRVEIAEALRQQRVDGGDGIGLDDLPPGAIEPGHVLLCDRPPAVAYLLRLDAGRLHRVGILRLVGVGHLIEIEDRRDLLPGGLRYAARIALGDAGDLLQLDAVAFDRIAADDRTGAGQHHDAAMQHDDRQQQRDDVRLPAAMVGKQRKNQLQHDDVPSVLRARQHHHAGQDQCDKAAAAQPDHLVALASPRTEQLVPHAERPHEREREQRRFRQRDRREHRERTA